MLFEDRSELNRRCENQYKQRSEKGSASSASDTMWLPHRARRQDFKHQKEQENTEPRKTFQGDLTRPDVPKGTVADYRVARALGTEIEEFEGRVSELGIPEMS